MFGLYPSIYPVCHSLPLFASMEFTGACHLQNQYFKMVAAEIEKTTKILKIVCNFH